MISFSRNMPKRAEQNVDRFAFACFLLLMIGILASPGLFWWPLAIVCPVVFLAISALGWRRDAQIMTARKGETICQFARSFDRHATDPWIIRAVYEELSDTYPVRPTDRLAEDLGIIDGDLEDTIESIAMRAGRNLKSIDDNPLRCVLITVDGSRSISSEPAKNRSE